VARVAIVRGVFLGVRCLLTADFTVARSAMPDMAAVRGTSGWSVCSSMLTSFVRVRVGGVGDEAHARSPDHFGATTSLASLGPTISARGLRMRAMLPAGDGVPPGPI
jgi:hypothetical protein